MRRQFSYKHKIKSDENSKPDVCITCADACETCSTENKGKEGMENSVKLCIVCADACNVALIDAKTDSNLDALCRAM
jgi:hypothetical protein